LDEHTSTGSDSVQGKVAIVTGGGGGIGRATCMALRQVGARVVVVDASREALDETLVRLGEPSADEEVLGLCLDVTDESDMEEMVARALARFERIDVLVCAAGILRGRGSLPKPLVEVTAAEWDEVLDVNLKGTFLSNRAVLAAMMDQREGHIVNISSTSGRRGRALDSAYCASKSAVIGLSEALAEEVRRSGIRVHVLLPDAVDTPLWDQNGPVPRPADALPADRVAEFIVYLLRMPRDCILLNPSIVPFKTRRRKSPKLRVEEQS
jgi:3-oxoacyl-[acyl-carrier protein] reductase